MERPLPVIGSLLKSIKQASAEYGGEELVGQFGDYLMTPEGAALLARQKIDTAGARYSQVSSNGMWAFGRPLPQVGQGSSGSARRAADADRADERQEALRPKPGLSPPSDHAAIYGAQPLAPYDPLLAGELAPWRTLVRVGGGDARRSRPFALRPQPARKVMSDP